MNARISKLKGYKIIGWLAIGYAIYEIIAALLGIQDITAMNVHSNIKNTIMIVYGGFIVIEALVYLAAGIAGIKANFKLGFISLTAAVILALLIIMGESTDSPFAWKNLYALLPPFFYACFLFPAHAESKANKL